MENSAAQQADVIHRDLKPANILINDDDLVKIVDFGIAAAAAQGDTRLTKSGIMVGTPKYMAPEQIRGGEIDARADIYTLGIVMYEMFTGNPPYEGGDAMATLFQHVEGNAKPPSEMNPQVDKALEEVILKAIAVDPQNRFQTFEQFRDSLAQLL